MTGSSSLVSQEAGEQAERQGSERAAPVVHVEMVQIVAESMVLRLEKAPGKRVLVLVRLVLFSLARDRTSESGQ